MWDGGSSFLNSSGKKYILNDIDNIYINGLSLNMGKLLSHIDEEFTIEVCNIFSKINEDDILYKNVKNYLIKNVKEA